MRKVLHVLTDVLPLPVAPMTLSKSSLSLKVELDENLHYGRRRGIVVITAGEKHRGLREVLERLWQPVKPTVR